MQPQAVQCRAMKSDLTVQAMPDNQPFGTHRSLPSGEKLDCSVVVPVYNSEATLPILHERLVNVLEGVCQTFEVIFVEDCGRDRSWPVLQEITEKDNRITAIRLMRNSGQASATMCGLAESRGQITITIDDDLQNPPEEIPKLLLFLADHSELDAVFGAAQKKQHAAWRNIASRLANRISARIFSKSSDLRLTSFRAIRRRALDAVLAINSPRPAPGAMVCSVTDQVANVEVEHHARMSDKGNYSLSKMVGLAIDRTLTFSTFPLRLLAIIGALGIGVSLILAAYYIVRYMIGGIQVAGWITQVLLLISISGFNFFAFGVIGEYLLRILHTAQFIPPYVVRDRIGGYKDPAQTIEEQQREPAGACATAAESTQVFRAPEGYR